MRLFIGIDFEDRVKEGLFESARVNGRLTYTPLHRAGLAGY